jgi:antirestriction protein ArdC
MTCNPASKEKTMKAQATSQTTKTSTRPAAPERGDVYERVTASIVAALEKGTRPWLKPWSRVDGEGAAGLPLRANGTPYRGINVLLLWGAAADAGYTAPMWMTYKQAAEQGGQVRKGERGSMVVYANSFTRTETDENGQDEEREIPFLKAYTVFNVAQIDGLKEVDASPVPVLEKPQLIETAEAFITGTGAVIRHGGNRAFYAPGSDHIQLPPVQAFRDVESYTATKAHELIHWTGHASRTAREFGKRFGDQAYAVEELVAELGAAFLCAELDVTVEPRCDHASYLAHWLQVLKEDKRAIFTAASQAQKAIDWLRESVPTP